jgi:hypothetical protein
MREIRMSGLMRGRGLASLPTLPVNITGYHVQVQSIIHAVMRWVIPHDQ